MHYKTVFIGLIARIQEHTKEFYCIPIYERNILTRLHCTKFKEINMRHSDVQKNMSNKKWYECFAYGLIQNISDILKTSFGNN